VNRRSALDDQNFHAHLAQGHGSGKAADPRSDDHSPHQASLSD
jgi:hypothetical protein